MNVDLCPSPWAHLLRSSRDSGLTFLAGLLVASSPLAQEDTSFRERYRPQFHYTAVKGWINDPIGLVYHEGEYHLFNDHNVKSTRFPGGKFDGEQSHWSHAVSKDLVHWEHRPVAVHPDKLGLVGPGPAWWTGRTRRDSRSEKNHRWCCTPTFPVRSVRRAWVGKKGISCQPPSWTRPGKDITENEGVTEAFS